MTPDRRLVVDLANLAAAASRAAALDDIPRVQAALIRAQTAATIALLDDAAKVKTTVATLGAAKTRAAHICNVRRRSASVASAQQWGH